MRQFNTLKKETVSEHQLEVGGIYQIQFLNGFKLLVKFAGFQGRRYYFFTETGGEFSLADNSIQYLKFYQT